MLMLNYTVHGEYEILKKIGNSLDLNPLPSVF